MTESWLFRDECFHKILSGLPGVTREAIASLRAEKKKYLSQELIDTGVITADQFIKAAEALSGIKYFPVAPEQVDRFALSLVSERICRKYDLLPFKLLENEIRVAMVAPFDMNAIADVEALAGRRVLPSFSLPREMSSSQDQLFSADTVIFDLLEKVEPPEEIQVLAGGGNEGSRDAAVTSPVIKLVNSIISQAYHKHASDIHIEHEEKSSHVRVRVDGDLRTIMKLPRYIAVGPVVSRIKIMADLDVANHMSPQDGRTKLRIGAAEVGLRVSTLPTTHGEKVVMRILDQRAAEVPFEKLGFAPEVSAAIDRCTAFSQGIMLVTGPTGSGKTTTLYSILNKIKHEATNVVTAEDPIEYKLAGINQVQVNEKQGLSFAAVLRSVLRQDPDIIMVGEIRDKETADIAFQAAMTGHFVLSTLHTNDTVSTISRLIDMGLDRFKISPGLLAITAQRLVRMLCPDCRERVPDAACPPEVMQALGDHGYERACYRGFGCKKCEGTGYSGRTSVVELLTVDPKIRELINSGAPAETIARAATASGNLRSMTRDCLWHLSQGHTDLKEVEPYLELKNGMDTDSVPAPVTAAAPAAVPQAGRPRVLVAEDDAVMRMLVRKFLEGAGYELLEAVDGEDALTKIAAGPPPDLLISDINMPKLNGYDLVKGVRETLGLADLPIIMLTTEASDQSQELAFKLGADDYIIKPFKAPLVMARVAAALRRAGRLK